MRRKKGGHGVAEASVAAADRRQTMDIERSAIRNPARGVYNLLVGRGEALVIRGARQRSDGGLPRQEGGRYLMDRMEGAVSVGAAR